jgi:NTE family protein
MKAVFLTLFVALIALGEEPAPPATPQRPKIGVALAGGAALGLAHVGVLQWMEENRIHSHEFDGQT